MLESSCAPPQDQYIPFSLRSHVILLLQTNYCSDNKSRLIKFLQLRIFYPVDYWRERQEVEQKLMSLSGYYCISLSYIT